MIVPVRLRLSRRKGFNLQRHSKAVNGLPAINVARPSKWGNPFIVGSTFKLDGHVRYETMSQEDAVHFFHLMLRRLDRTYPSDAEIFGELRNRNLACWCKPDVACHADVLIDIANRSVS